MFNETAIAYIAEALKTESGRKAAAEAYGMAAPLAAEAAGLLSREFPKGIQKVVENEIAPLNPARVLGRVNPWKGASGHEGTVIQSLVTREGNRVKVYSGLGGFESPQISINRLGSLEFENKTGLFKALMPIGGQGLKISAVGGDALDKAPSLAPRIGEPASWPDWMHKEYPGLGDTPVPAWFSGQDHSWLVGQATKDVPTPLVEAKFQPDGTLHSLTFQKPVKVEDGPFAGLSGQIFERNPGAGFDTLRSTYPGEQISYTWFHGTDLVHGVRRFDDSDEVDRVSRALHYFGGDVSYRNP